MPHTKFRTGSRGVGDILISVTDGLKGMPEVLAAVFPATTLRISAIVTAHFGDRDRWPGGGDSGPFRHRDRPFRRS